MEKCLSIQVFSVELALKTGSVNDPWGSNPVSFNIPLWQHSMLIHFTKWTGSKSFWHILNYEIAYWWYEYEQVFFRTVCKMALLEMLHHLCAVTISAEHDGNICFLLRCFEPFFLMQIPAIVGESCTLSCVEIATHSCFHGVSEIMMSWEIILNVAGWLKLQVYHHVTSTSIYF